MKISKKAYLLAFIVLTLVGIIMSLPFLEVTYESLTPCDIYCKFNEDAKDLEYQKSIGLSIVNLSSSEDREIKNILRSTLEKQRSHYNDEDPDRIDELIIGLYLPEGYQSFKEQMKYEKEERKQHGSYIESTPDAVVSYMKNIKFSKFRKYNGLDDRIGIIAGSHYFLLKKINNKWIIENEYVAIGFLEELSLPESDIVHELLLKKKNSESQLESQ